MKQRVSVPNCKRRVNLFGSARSLRAWRLEEPRLGVSLQPYAMPETPHQDAIMLPTDPHAVSSVLSGGALPPCDDAIDKKDNDGPHHATQEPGRFSGPVPSN